MEHIYQEMRSEIISTGKFTLQKIECMMVGLGDSIILLGCVRMACGIAVRPRSTTPLNMYLEALWLAPKVGVRGSSS